MEADIKKDINLLNTRKHLKRNSLVFLLEPKGSKVLSFGIQIDKVDSICPHQLYDSKGLFQVYLVRLEDIKEGKN